MRPRRVPPFWLFPMVLLCFASGLLGLTFVEQGHGDIMARCVLYFGVFGAMVYQNARKTPGFSHAGYKHGNFPKFPSLALRNLTTFRGQCLCATKMLKIQAVSHESAGAAVRANIRNLPSGLQQSA